MRTIHIIPVDDLIDHDLAEDCVCGPDVELVPTDNGDCWQVSHESLDRREDREPEVVHPGGWDAVEVNA